MDRVLGPTQETVALVRVGFQPTSGKLGTWLKSTHLIREGPWLLLRATVL